MPERVSDYQRRVFERQIAIEAAREGLLSRIALDNLAYAAEHALALGEIMSGQSGEEVRHYMGGSLKVWCSSCVRIARCCGKTVCARAWTGTRWWIDGMVKLLFDSSHSVSAHLLDTPSMQRAIARRRVCASVGSGFSQSGDRARSAAAQHRDAGRARKGFQTVARHDDAARGEPKSRRKSDHWRISHRRIRCRIR